MAAEKSKTVYVCSECGYETPKWFGQCPGCNDWNTLSEEIKVVSSQKKGIKSVVSSSKVVSLGEVTLSDEIRLKTGLKELDGVLGGGLVKSSLVLLSGDPGIGKSTLLLQICQHIGLNHSVLYVSGEESVNQIKMRAERLNVTTENLSVMCEMNMDLITNYISVNKPDIVIVDSIQTMSISEISSYPGSISQVRECTNMLMRTTKNLGITTIVVGHVNKDGNIAGPKVLEHIVDAVLYFEGDRHMSYRMLRAVKNRFGSTNEIGVFDMTSDGLEEVENPSLMLISGRPINTPGSCVACVIEGSRPIMAEVQALVSPSGFGNPRRMATGFDYNRMSMLIAVLEKRGGYFFGNMDVYVNVIGGMRLDEPASDLSVALSLVSSLKDVAVPEDILAFGEIGLGGEIRGVKNCDMRIKEAERLGFTKCIIPYSNLKNLKNLKSNIEIIGVRYIRQAFDALK